MHTKRHIVIALLSRNSSTTHRVQKYVLGTPCISLRSFIDGLVFSYLLPCDKLVGLCRKSRYQKTSSNHRAVVIPQNAVSKSLFKIFLGFSHKTCYFVKTKFKGCIFKNSKFKINNYTF